MLWDYLNSTILVGFLNCLTVVNKLTHHSQFEQGQSVQEEPFMKFLRLSALMEISVIKRQRHLL